MKKYLKLLKSLGVFVLATIGGIFYRMGGSGNFPRWTRLAGECIAMVLVMWMFGQLNWSIFICFALMWGLLTTYFKKKGTDAMWYNWTMVGFAFGFSMIPWVLYNHYALHINHWTGFGIRTAACTFLVPIWQCQISQKVSNLTHFGKDITDEVGRGFINIITLPFLLL